MKYNAEDDKQAEYLDIKDTSPDLLPETIKFLDKLCKKEKKLRSGKYGEGVFNEQDDELKKEIKNEGE